MKRSLAYYSCALVTCGNALTSLAFSLIAFVQGAPGDAGNMYSLVRTICLAVAALFGAAVASLDVLFVLAPLLGSIQAGDAIVGWRLDDISKTIGPALLSALTFVSVIWLARQQ